MIWKEHTFFLFAMLLFTNILFQVNHAAALCRNSTMTSACSSSVVVLYIEFCVIWVILYYTQEYVLCRLYCYSIIKSIVLILGQSKGILKEISATCKVAELIEKKRWWCMAVSNCTYHVIIVLRKESIAPWVELEYMMCLFFFSW